MSEQLSTTPTRSSKLVSPPVRLWTPGVVALTAFLFGFPGGIVLASINWVRMGLTSKASAHLVGGAIGALLLVVFLIQLPSLRELAVLINVGVLYYLQNQIKNDLETFTANHEVQPAHWLSGFLIGLVMLGFLYLLVLGVGSIMGVPMSA